MKCLPRLLLEILNGPPDLCSLASRIEFLQKFGFQLIPCGVFALAMARNSYNYKDHLVVQNIRVEQYYRYDAHCCKISTIVVAVVVEISLEVPDLGSTVAAAGLDATATIRRLPCHKLGLDLGIGIEAAKVVVVVAGFGLVVV
ncbi:hypothetical protein L2E82_45457 [Cichorium intybus]|uniref:Uncharacterized protein n=1 Tax=Cichorium intybus TaxID=13427 RepID=A0ACB8ZSY5_CICIN|nr:hypothetical protein L2E82_45457 [Cichorium intybus]